MLIKENPPYLMPKKRYKSDLKIERLFPLLNIMRTIIPIAKGKKIPLHRRDVYCWRALTALVENLRSLPSTNMGWLTTACNFSSRAFDALWPLWVPTHKWCSYKAHAGLQGICGIVCFKSLSLYSPNWGGITASATFPFQGGCSKEQGSRAKRNEVPMQWHSKN